MEKYTDIEKDLQIIEDFFVEEDVEDSFNNMCHKMDILLIILLLKIMS